MGSRQESDGVEVTEATEWRRAQDGDREPQVLSKQYQNCASEQTDMRHQSVLLHQKWPRNDCFATTIAHPWRWLSLVLILVASGSPACYMHASIRKYCVILIFFNL